MRVETKAGTMVVKMVASLAERSADLRVARMALMWAVPMAGTMVVSWVERWVERLVVMRAEQKAAWMVEK